MSLLRRIRTELAGAWRSVRYDLGRRPAEPPAGGPDITSTGMSTFAGHLVEPPRSAVAARPARRAVAASALGMLTVTGAAVAYLGVVNGLAPLLNETPASADTFPPQPAMTGGFTPHAGIGRGPAERTTTPPRAAAGAAALPRTARPATGRPVTREASPIRTKPTNHECPCGEPPVPTPTAPTDSPSPTPSEAPEPSGSPPPSGTTATPDESTEPSDSPQFRRRRYRG